MSVSRQDTETTPAGLGSMRAAASWFIDRPTLPRHGDVTRFALDFHRYLQRLMPHIEELAARLDSDDIPAKAALAGVGEARRRLIEPEAVGLNGEVTRVKRLARSVLVLCDHYDMLIDLAVCRACDRAIGDGQSSVSYDQASPSGGASRSGRVHTDCANSGIRAGR
ncbi:DUF6415 family natural product biosynthesis protein [Streptomyces sp. NPDC086080]|uniref:DUF6415 family natural product biosynthesis protein n=1 Tax=Streptomyces sp. NPDC086080 TaxID=3365748 RepID=UPI0037D54399